MKKILLVILSFGLVMVAAPRALAVNQSVSGGCDTSVRPAPYTGGAAVSHVFYPADGSTVTVTATGAVIKQSPCQTPYREGWVNTADLVCLNSADELTVRLKPGAKNPYVNVASSCPVTPSSGTVPQKSSVVTTASQTQTLSSSTSSAKSSAASASKKPTSHKKASTLPDTGAGDVLAIGGISSLLAAAGHYVYKTRRFRIDT